MSTVLSNKALLVTLNISQWTARKHDKRASDTVETTHKSDRKVGNYTKKLLPGAVELEIVHNKAAELRTWVYSQTLPWYTDGSRILSSRNYLDFTTQFRDKKIEFETAVTNFLMAYQTLKTEAKVKLGDLYKDEEYPTEAYLKNAFKCEVSFMPIPDIKDFRVEVLAEELETFEKRMKETENNAMRECWDRLHSAVSHAASRLHQNEGQIRDSLIENIKEICIVLPKLNFADDPKLEGMRQEVEKVTAGIVPSQCRGSINARQQAAKQLDDVMAKMSAYMG
jgi:hypothetical protein